VVERDVLVLNDYVMQEIASKKLCIRCCPCKEKGAAVLPWPIALCNSKLKATLKIKDLAIQTIEEEVTDVPKG
jgi:hypothetical protein